jgi:hypothetical protein
MSSWPTAARTPLRPDIDPQVLKQMVNRHDGLPPELP